MEDVIDESMLMDMLPLYYKRVFPATQFIKWLSYGEINYLKRREFSFTLADEVYLRYQTFDSVDAFCDALQTKKPIKIDIGAVYNIPPTGTGLMKRIRPEEKELVFDIDLTDYDEIRTCCSGANVCNKCWKFMVLATKILNLCLREDFGFKHLLWVFSGRRGIHCWVSDKNARSYSEGVREGLIEFVNLLKGGQNQAKKVNIRGKLIHHSIQRSLDIIMPHFEEILVEQDFLGSDKQMIDFIKILEPEVRETYETAMMKEKTSIARWKSFLAVHKNYVMQGNVKKQAHLVEEIVLQFAYPRLDVNVSKGVNHLLKAPFCVHPKTGKVSIPFNPNLIDKFDPSTVPTLSQLVKEINEFVLKVAEQEKDLADDQKSTSSATADYKKTGLFKSVRVFDEFVRGLEEARKRAN